MPDELERLQINIEADASGTVAGAAQAKQAMQSMAETTQNAVDTVGSAMQQTAKKTSMLKTAIQQTGKAAQDMSGGKPLKLENLERVYEAQIKRAETVKAKIEELKSELTSATRRSSMTGDTSGMAAAEEKVASEELKYAKLVEQIDATAEKIWQLEDAMAGASNDAEMEKNASATEKVSRSASKAAENVRNVRKEIERVGRKGPTLMNSIGRSLRSMLIVTAVAGGLRNFVRWMGNVVSADKQVSASLAQVRGNLLTAFAPIYNVIIPAIRTLCSWLATATAWLSSFLGGLFGMSSSAAKDTANNIANIGGAAGGAGKEMKELLGSFDELNKLDRSKSGGGGGGGGGNIEFGEQIENTINGGSRLQNAFKAVGETVSTFALALGGLKIAQQVAQWLAPLSGIANANAATLGKLGLAITAVVAWYKSLKEVVSSEEFRIKWENIVASDDAWWQKALKIVGFGFESLAASLIGMVTQFFWHIGFGGLACYNGLGKWTCRTSCVKTKGDNRRIF